MLNKGFRLAVICLILTACAHKPLRRSDVATQPGTEATVGPDGAITSIVEKEVSSEDVEANVSKPYQSSMGDIALDHNSHVEKWLNYFQGRGRPHMEVYLSRSSRYLPMMKNVLRENGLPEDLVYIALIESGFSPKAHSRSNAVGYWQFIKQTGRRYGLHVDSFIDERRDPVLSTRAAAEYFKALYNLFGSWHLSLAAYNVGENRVKRAVMKYYTRDIWELISKRRSLPAETKQYVPKFIAAAMIAKDPAKYGFGEIEAMDPLSYDTVALVSSISLKKLASNLNVDVEELKLLNPKFRGDYVPMSRNGETIVRIPVGMGQDALAAINLSTSVAPKVVANGDYFFYRVRRGDNLSIIAKRHRTSVSTLRRLNGLSNRTLLRPGQRLQVPDQGGEGHKIVEDAGGSDRDQASVRVKTDTEIHKVRRGENLTTIARKYGISISELREWNGLDTRSVLRSGQMLRVKPKAERNMETSSKVRSRSKVKAPMQVAAAQTVKRVHHRIRRGETLTSIAQKYKISVHKLAQVNRISPSSRLVAGLDLVVPH